MRINKSLKIFVAGFTRLKRVEFRVVYAFNRVDILTWRYAVLLSLALVATTLFITVLHVIIPTPSRPALIK